MHTLEQRPASQHNAVATVILARNAQGTGTSVLELGHCSILAVISGFLPALWHGFCKQTEAVPLSAALDKALYESDRSHPGAFPVNKLCNGCQVNDGCTTVWNEACLAPREEATDSTLQALQVRTSTLPTLQMDACH